MVKQSERIAPKVVWMQETLHQQVLNNLDSVREMLERHAQGKADAGDLAWAQCCVEQADRLLQQLKMREPVPVIGG
jgi:hypothetical protein